MDNNMTMGGMHSFFRTKGPGWAHALVLGVGEVYKCLYTCACRYLATEYSGELEKEIVVARCGGLYL